MLTKHLHPCQYDRRNVALVLGPDTLRAAPDVEHPVSGSVAQSKSTQNHIWFANNALVDVCLRQGGVCPLAVGTAASEI